MSRSRNPPSRRSVRLGAVQRWSLYVLLAVLVLSGALWLGVHQSGEQAVPRPIEPWMMRLHGAAAMLIVFAVGTLLYGHVLPAWNLGRNRPTGAIVATALLVLAVSGYGLYYFGGDELRRATEWLHWLVGFAAPLALGWHIRRGRAQTRLQ
jgi:hypothetical protein